MSTQKRAATINGIDMSVLRQTVGAIEKESKGGKSHLRIRNKWISGNSNCMTVDVTVDSR